MGRLYIILLLFFISLTAIQPVHAQFWKKKTHHTRATSGKVTKPDNTPYRDAFSRKSSKGPNIKTTRKPFFKSKKKMHEFNTTRKTKKPGQKKFFKPKYNSVKLNKKSKDNFSRNANRVKKDSKKGGGKGNGVFRGRKR
ncbi:MAG: hypothetical protein RIC15_01930 [Vicingaceae bacterium]